MLREIRLYGELGRRFGRLHRMAVSTPAEAIRALMANFPEFERALLEVAPGYRVLVGKKIMPGVEALYDPQHRDDCFKIVPMMAGAKKGGLFGFILGAVLTVVGVAFGQVWLIQAGVGLMLGGVVQMLTPVPKMQAGSDAPDKPSYLFNGADNITAQGNPVPVGYGRMIVGSVQLSVGIDVADFDRAAEDLDVGDVQNTVTDAWSADVYAPPGSAGFGPYPDDPGFTFPEVPGDYVPTPDYPFGGDVGGGGGVFPDDPLKDIYLGSEQLV